MAEQRAPGLQTLFAIFLGLMVTAFVGVGVYTFYPNPARDFRTQIMNLDRQQQAIGTLKPDVALTPEDRAKIQELVDQRNKLQDQSQAASETWGSRTSIILVSLATLVMVVSLTVAKNLPVISNGLLMGGVFTMLYGVGWVIASGTSTTRFIVPNGFGTQCGQVGAGSSHPGSQHHRPSTTNLYSYRPGGRSRVASHVPSARRVRGVAAGSHPLNVPATQTTPAPGA